MKRWLAIGVAVIVLGGLTSWYWARGNHRTITWRTATVERGNLQVTISATGTVEPEEVVDVGAQVQGQIKSLGVDPNDSTKSVDYCTPVEEGTILAQIDDALYTSDVDQAAAALEVAKASQQRSEADLAELKAKARQAARDWGRAQEMQKRPGSISDQDYDMYQANNDSARSLLTVGEAMVVQSKRSVAQAETVLKKSQKNLGYCTIRSPVKGVIIDRRVNVGQTVVSSLNAPSLFLIAKDLKRMQVWVSVNEADIGQIHQGQAVSFNVDAFPGETFHGQVGKIRLNATMTQNVVTYTVEVNTDNSSGKLLPYLTANLQFEVGRRDNVLLVPNAALRWWPQPQNIAPAARDSATKDGRSKTGSNDKDRSERSTIWLQDGNFVRPLRVQVGSSDGTLTEVSGEGLTEGLEVVIGEGRSNGSDSTSNPFAPKLFNSGKSQ